MKQLKVILIIIFFFNINSYSQKLDNYKLKFGKLIINLPSKPVNIDVREGEMVKLNTPKGKFIAIKIDLSNQKDKLPVKDSIKEFYIKVINDRFADWNIKPNEILFYKIGDYETVLLPVKDQYIGVGFCILALIKNEYYSIMYTTNSDANELEYSKEEFISLIKLNN